MQSTVTARCILLLALPRSFDAIDSALKGGSYADYVGRGLLWGNARELWERNFKGVALAAQSLAEEAATLGVVVRQDAALADLAAAFGAFDVITIVAHWRGPELAKGDLNFDAPLIAKRLSEDADEVPGRLRVGLPPDWLARLDAPASGDIKRSRMAELLDSRLKRLPALTAPPEGTQWYMDAITLRHHNRSALDRWWPDAFKAGNRLEMADGLHSIEDIAGIIPESWAGVADFSNCQSAQLIPAIKRYRADRIVVANELETNPLSRLALLRGVYGLLANGWDYVEARQSMADRISREADNSRGNG